ncbi:MAG: hypothetical protein H0W72_02515 [Planctomycetes bacterium]|nr:hypothetical protein [Planctomycetota bacterium]
MMTFDWILVVVAAWGVNLIIFWYLLDRHSRERVGRAALLAVALLTLPLLPIMMLMALWKSIAVTLNHMRGTPHIEPLVPDLTPSEYAKFQRGVHDRSMILLGVGFLLIVAVAKMWGRPTSVGQVDRTGIDRNRLVLPESNPNRK